jgi:hypothetical protein
MTDNLFFIDEDEVLAHHGVKGMKWGVRKQRAASGGAGSTKKRKGLSRKQKAAIAGVLGTAAAAGAGYYLHKSGKGKKIAALAKKHGASAKDFAKGKGRNLGAQARVKSAQAKRFAKAQSANAKSAAEKLKTTKAGKYAEATRLAANAAAFKTGHAARSAGFRAKQGAWKVGNKARRTAAGGVGGVKSAAGMAARSAKSKAGSAAGKAASAAKSAAGKASRAAKSPGASAKSAAYAARYKFAKKATGKEVGFRKLATHGTRVVRPKSKFKLTNSDKIALVGAAGLSANLAGAAVGAARNRKKTRGSKKRRR